MNTKKDSEIWRKIKGLENYFAVSNLGNVKSFARDFFAGNHMQKKHKEETILRPRITRGYYSIILDIAVGEFRFRRGIPIHRLVAQEFCENRLGRNEVNHIDGDKLNNKAENLEWVSRSENLRHAYALGLHKTPKGNLKFKSEKILKVFELRKQNLKHKEIAEKLGMGVSTVTHILLGSRRSKQ